MGGKILVDFAEIRWGGKVWVKEICRHHVMRRTLLEALLHTLKYVTFPHDTDRKFRISFGFHVTKWQQVEEKLCLVHSEIFKLANSTCGNKKIIDITGKHG